MTRRHLLAAATAVVVLAGIAFSSFATARPASAFASARPASASSTSNGITTGRSMVLIGTAGLSWSDVSPRTTPTLWSLLRNGSTASLTVHAVHANTCPVDGWLTLSAGEQAADVGGGGADSAKPPCRELPAETTEGKVPHWSEYRAAAGASRFDAKLGLLGDQVADHGGCVQAVGPGAALGATRTSGLVLHYQPYDTSTLPSALAACAVTLIDVGAVRDPADLNPGDEIRPKTSRAQQVAAVDARAGQVLMATPAGTDVLFASLADAGVTERLRAAALTGPHFGAGTLESSSTRQPGLVQLTDLTATILQHLGIPRPPSLGGAPLQVVPSDESSDKSADQRLRALLDDDEASHKVHSLVEPFFYGWALLQLAWYLAAGVIWKRGQGTQAQRLRLLLNTRRVAIIAASVPVSTFLANILPWWRLPAPMVSVVASVALFATALSALALLGPWRNRPLGPLAVVCSATMAVLALDVMTGSRLQLSSLLGLQPIIGGRFYGMGNVTFALFATATLMLCVAVASYLVHGAQRRYAAAAVAAVGVGAVVVDASPWWGSDLGGPTALLPAVILLVLMTLQVRLTWRVAAAIGAGISTFVVLLGLVDWLRPAESRSHLGKFVQTAIDGGAWDIVARKLGQNITVMLGYPLALLIPLVLALFAYLLARPTSRAARPLQRSFASIPLLRPGLIAVLVMWVIGFVLNDSGTVIPANGLLLAFPLLVSVALRTLADQRVATSATTRASRLRR